jgi:hypothetical protein
MQFILGRRCAVSGTSKLEEIINGHGIKGIVTQSLLSFSFFTLVLVRFG